MDKQPIVVGV